MAKAKKIMVPRTRNGGEWTESMFFGRIRAALRRMWMFWKPRRFALEAARRPYTGPNKAQKWEFKCGMCNDWHKQKDVETHHKIEAGSLRKLEDLPGFVERLFVENPDDLVVLCKLCHKKMHKNENK